MNRRDLLGAAAVAAAWPWIARAGAAAPGPPTALVGGLLIDGYGGEPLADSVVLIEGERVAAVGTVGSLEIPEHAQRVSTEGCTVLPGLWDMNVHLTRLGHADAAHWDELYLPLAERVVMPIAMSALLAAGVTSVRDVESPLEAALAMRERVRERLLPGPAIYATGPVLAPSASHTVGYRLVARGTAEVRARVGELARAGVDAIVIDDLDGFTAADAAALVRAAQSAGIGVHARIARDGEFALALEAGVDGVIGIGDGVDPWPAPTLEALRRRLASPRSLVVTTNLSAPVNTLWLAANHEPLDDPRWREGWPPVVAEDVRGSLDNVAALALAYPNAAARRAAYAARVGALLEAGALLVVGSGAGRAAQLPGQSTAQEIEVLVRDAGLSPLEAIRRATYWPAVAAGQQHVSGTIGVGKSADLVSVRGDVLRHIDRLADAEVVFRRGVRCR